MARYQVDKSRYEELLVGTTITSCSIGNNEILIDTNSEKDLIITIDTNTAFWRIRNNDSIIASSFSLISEQHSECDDFEALEGISSFEASLEDTNQLMNGLILGMKINEVKTCDIDLMLKLENGTILEVFKANDSENIIPCLSLLSGTKGLSTPTKNLISNEIRNLYKFETADENVKLSKSNVRLAETIFRILNINSTLEQDFRNLEANYSVNTLDQVCITINSENSTHLREYERNKICNEIIDNYKTINDFKEALKNTSYPIIKLIRTLKNTTVTVTNDRGENKDKIIRDNYSFATKLCHYACYYLFDDDAERDFYPVYDSVVSDYVKSSAEYINAPNKKIDKHYNDYVSVIDEIINNNSTDTEHISRNGFDHLIWLTKRKSMSD